MQPKQVQDGKQGCRIEGCDRKYSCKGLCAFHSGRQRLGIPLEAGNLLGENFRRRGARIHAMSQLPDDIKEAYGA